MSQTEALAHLSRDPHLGPLVARISLSEAQSNGDVYYGLLENVISQQLSARVAPIIFNRFLSLFPGGYPHAALLLALDAADTLRAVGISRGKAQYLQNVALFFQENALEGTDWSGYADDELVTYLSQIRGVGRWTVEMILMFTLHRPDVFPADDFGIQQAMRRLFGLTPDRYLKARMQELAEPWRPYRTTACRLLWRWKDL